NMARVAAVGAVVFLGGCGLFSDDGWLGGNNDGPPLPGERISVLLLDRDLEPDPELVNSIVELPAPQANLAWPQPGGNPTHVMNHLASGPELAVAWRVDLGAGESDDNLILATPVIAQGVAFAIDSASQVTALDLESRKILWQRDMQPEEEDDSASLGGGVAFDQDKLYVTTAFGELAALDAASGEIVWSRKLRAPLRGSPTIAGGRVYAISFDNRTHALDAATGATLWTHSGITETAGLLGAASPAVVDDLVLVPYSSGELFALRVENGRPAWTTSLIYQGRVGATTALSDIDGSPAVDGGIVYAVSNSGRLVALELNSGLPIWEQEVASAQTPWIAGDYIFVLTTESELVCLRKVDGRIRWVLGLPQFENEEDRVDPILWAGPILIGDRLVVVNDLGEAVAVSPYQGEIIGRLPLGTGARLSPIAVGDTLYVYTVEAELLALR
ncbi:MAG: outer membrane protein assembly factor BamB family protein, partial [Alphaproteobacteria bacterium]